MNKYIKYLIIGLFNFLLFTVFLGSYNLVGALTNDNLFIRSISFILYVISGTIMFYKICEYDYRTNFYFKKEIK